MSISEPGGAGKAPGRLFNIKKRTASSHMQRKNKKKSERGEGEDGGVNEGKADTHL